MTHCAITSDGIAPLLFCKCRNPQGGNHYYRTRNIEHRYVLGGKWNVGGYDSGEMSPALLQSLSAPHVVFHRGRRCLVAKFVTSDDLASASPPREYVLGPKEISEPRALWSSLLPSTYAPDKSFFLTRSQQSADSLYTLHFISRILYRIGLLSSRFFQVHGAF